MTFMAPLIQTLANSRIEDNKLIIPNVVSDWPLENMDEVEIPEQISKTQTRWTMVEDNGVIKSSLMTLGIEHFHSNEDIIITKHWEALLEGLGFEIYENNIRKLKKFIGKDKKKILICTDGLGRRESVAELLIQSGQNFNEIEAWQDFVSSNQLPLSL